MGDLGCPYGDMQLPSCIRYASVQFKISCFLSLLLFFLLANLFEARSAEPKKAEKKTATTKKIRLIF